MPDPIALTIISPSYRKVGREAVRRVRNFTGLDVHVVQCKDSNGFEAKLSLEKEVGNRDVMFFDADWWALRTFDARSLFGGWCGVHDPTVFHEHCFPHKDCVENGLLFDRYLNTGWFCFRGSNPQHRAVFKRARQVWKRVQSGKQKTYDHTDQFCINKAMLDLGVVPQLMPRAYNFFLFSAMEGCCEIPREIFGLHGAGIMSRKSIEEMRKKGAKDLPTLDKYEELVIQSQVFGRRVIPMKDAAVRMAYAVTHELR